MSNWILTLDVDTKVRIGDAKVAEELRREFCFRSAEGGNRLLLLVDRYGDIDLYPNVAYEEDDFNSFMQESCDLIRECSNGSYALTGAWILREESGPRRIRAEINKDGKVISAPIDWLDGLHVEDIRKLRELAIANGMLPPEGGDPV